MNKILSKLSSNKTNINWNKNPIDMDLFLYFLNVEVFPQTKFLGSSTGWTQYQGDNNLIITGGRIGSKHYLDSIQYGKNLDNPYNNYVNPFYLFDIMNQEGKKFFLKYYKDDIDALLNKNEEKLKYQKEILKKIKIDNSEEKEFFKELRGFND